MNRLALALLLGAGTAAAAPSQDANLQPFNWRWGAQGQHPVTGQWYPIAATQPPGYIQPTGVAPGTRIWLHVPEVRFQGGHRDPSYVTITGMAQNIIVGAAIVSYPPPGGYQFGTGLAPAARVMRPHEYEHATTGNDVAFFPPASLAFTHGDNFRHTFTLTTPVPVPRTPLVLFVEYQGGEYRESTTNGQTISSDWQGGTGASGAIYAGFSVGNNPRAIAPYGSPLWLPQIGMIVDEPVFAATGYHANDYYLPPFQNEDYLAVGGAFADWTTKGPPQASLFFNVRAGSRFANGNAIVLAEFGPGSFPGRLPTPFGYLLLDPGNPLFTALSGTTLLLDPFGEYAQGPNNPILVPLISPGALGWLIKFQTAVADSALTTVALTNASGIVIQ